MSVYVPVKIKRQVERDSNGKCGYCLSRDELLGAPLEIEHISPISSGGETERENLWMACRSCNSFKADRTHHSDPITGNKARLFNPRSQNWNEHFQWIEDGVQIEGCTETGRATTEMLQMNHQFITSARKIWIASGEHPPGFSR